MDSYGFLSGIEKTAEGFGRYEPPIGGAGRHKSGPLRVQANRGRSDALELVRQDID